MIRIERKQIKLAEVYGERPFARRDGEGLAEIRARLLANDGLLAGGHGELPSVSALWPAARLLCPYL